MKQTFSTQEKLREYFKLFTPILITQIALIGGNFVAVFLTGQYSTDHLAGMSVGFNIWIAIYTAILGILYGITPIISNLLGANKLDDLKHIIQHGLYLSTAFGIVVIILGFITMGTFISILNLSPEAHNVAIQYMLAIATCFLPLFWICTMRNVIDSHGYTQISMNIILTGFLVNILTNYAFIFGQWGFPRLGGVGAGWAVSLSIWFNCIVYFLVLKFKAPFKKYDIFSNWASLNFAYWKEQLRLGVPMGISIFCEMSIFSLATFAMAAYGTKMIAAHQAALSFTTIFYCFPLTISLAATILVAYEVGAQRYRDARHYSNISRIFAIFVAIILATFGFTQLHRIAAIYTNDVNMVGLIAHFLSYALFFCIIDAFGTPVQGILRGYKDVKVITVIAISCYWGVGIPTASIFSYLFGFGPYGIWIGMLTGVGVAGLFYIIRLRLQEKKFTHLVDLSHKRD